MENKPKITWDAVVEVVVVVEERKWVVQCRWTSWMPAACIPSSSLGGMASWLNGQDC
jgi:hypothetical protein